MERDLGLQATVEAAALDALPAAVEVAAYRIATEALTNVSRVPEPGTAGWGSP